jgi:dihydrofolate reductase
MMSNVTYSFIAACDLYGGIGKDGKIPWHIKQDMKRFRDLTCSYNKTNIIIMGRRTWESLNCKPLVGRINIVVSQTLSSSSELYVFDKGVYFVSCLENALRFASEKTKTNIFVIGGERLYIEAMSDSRCINGYLTFINNTFNCDTHFPINLMYNYETIYDGKWQLDEGSGLKFRYIDVTRI